MKKLRLSKSDFDFLSSNMELSKECVKLPTPENKGDFIEFQVEDYSDFQTMMNFDIINDGMDNQNTVNELGKRMYRIYDKILAQKTNKAL